MTFAIIFALLTLAVLIMGIITMGRGKKGHSNLSNKLMMLRVLFQAIAVVCIIVVALYA